MPSTRIVITGIGWVTPLGWDIHDTWQRILHGQSGVARTRRFDASTFPTAFSSQVPADYDHRPLVRDPDLHQHVSLNTSFALGAAAMAWRAAGLPPPDASTTIDPERTGIYLGSGEGVPDFEAYVGANLAGWDAQRRAVHVPRWADAARALMLPEREIEQEPNMPLAHLALEFNAQGPAYNCLTACAASTQAIGEATAILRRGDADLMIAGGAHTMIHPLGVTGFTRLTALSRRNDSPLTASRPFSVDRDGFVIGEGAGMLILESLEHARQRGARVLAEIVGYGSSADAYRITDIHPDGRGAIAAMRQALSSADLTPADIDYISAHGTGTKENDTIETLAVRQVFGDALFRPRRSVASPDPRPPTAMSSVKSMLGHLIAAAGAVELITCVLAIRDNILPPTINLHTPDPACDLDYVPNTARPSPVDICLSNSFGFGGQNDTLVLRRFH